MRLAAVQSRAQCQVEENELALRARRVQMLSDLFATGCEPSVECTRAAHAVSAPRAKLGERSAAPSLSAVVASSRRVHGISSRFTLDVDTVGAARVQLMLGPKPEAK